MIKRILFLSSLLLLISCTNIELVLNKDSGGERFKNKTKIIVKGLKESRFVEGLYTYVGKNNNSEYLLFTNFSEKKENVLVKKIK